MYSHDICEIICTSWPKDGRNAAETCSQEPFSCSNIVSFIIVVYDVKNIYAYNVTQRDGFRQVETFTDQIHPPLLYASRYKIYASSLK